MEIIHDFGSTTSDKTANGFAVNTSAYLKRGLEIFKMKIEYFVLFTLVFFILTAIPGFGVLISQALAAGFLLVAFYLSTGKQVFFEDFFDGFKHFAGLLLLTLVSYLLIFVGFLLLFIPGIYLAVSYIFAPFFIIFSKMDFWMAMETSRKLVSKEWFSIFGFLFVLVCINIVGAMALGIGLLFTIPFSYCAIYAAFDDIIGISK